MIILVLGGKSQEATLWGDPALFKRSPHRAKNGLMIENLCGCVSNLLHRERGGEKSKKPITVTAVTLFEISD